MPQNLLDLQAYTRSRTALSRELLNLRTANSVAQNAGILHSVFMEQLTNGEVNSVVSFLNDDLFPDLARTVESRMARIRSRGFDRGPWTTQQYKKMFFAVEGLIRGSMKGASSLVRERLQRISVYEARFTRDMINSIVRSSVGPGIIVDTVTPSAPILRSIVTSKPFEGRLLREWFDGLARSTQNAVKSQINIGIASGEPTEKIVRRLTGTASKGFRDGVMQTTRRQASTIVRTATNHVANQAAEATYAKSKTVKGVRWLSTLDGRTTDICIANDGQVFGIYEGPRPPAHHQCRSRIVPVLKSWKELGINLKEAKPGTRASMNGQVPAKLTYNNWLKTQPKGIQDEVLGRRRAEIFRRGNVPVQRFVNRSGKSLTLPELEKLETSILKTGKLPKRSPK